MKAALVAALGAGVAIPAFGLFLRYRRDLNAARARLAAVERHVISTPWAAVEYAERGDGDPVLVVHGIFHNCVGGLLSVRDFSDRRFIAPSRFGYLSSSIPSNATVAAQADAFVALLDALDIGQVDVIGESAGATSALQLALRHPGRVKHLAVLVGNLPGSPTAVVQPSLAKLFNRQLPLWALRPGRLARGEQARGRAHSRRAVCQPRIGRAPDGRPNESHPRRARRFLCRADRSPRGAGCIVSTHSWCVRSA